MQILSPIARPFLAMLLFAVTTGMSAQTGPASVSRPMPTQVSVWPNPFNDVIHVNLPTPASTPVTFRLLDLQGVVVQEVILSTPTGGTVSTTSVGPGHYVLHLIVRNKLFHQQQMEKFVIE